jgi:hypothetical protein
MSKRSPKKSKRRSKALPALGFAGVSLSMASGACASTTEASANTPPTSQSQSHEIFLGDEEIFDGSLSTFFTFDKENAGQASLAQQLKFARGCGGCGCGHGGGCGCGHGGGCGCGHGGGCGGWHGGCGFHRACRCGGFRFRGCGCGGCGGCGCGGCGICWTWPWVGWCWGESTPPAQVASVASEQSAQTVEIAVKRDGSTDAGTKQRLAKPTQ